MRRAPTGSMKTVYPETEDTLRNHRAPSLDDAPPEVSIFLPVFNEEPNLRPLHARLDAALQKLGRTAEVIYVDDGSSDGSLNVLRELAAKDSRVRVIALRRNYGQTPAMAAGIHGARGRVLIPMDADMQNDPADIARLLDKLDEGYDVVSGWRKNRQDKLITRKIPSMIANRMISWIGGVPLHDYGCSLKAYRRESLADVQLYGEMHRFIPDEAALCLRLGGVVDDVALAFVRRLRVRDEVRQLAAPRGLCSDTLAGADHGHAGAGHSVFPDGPFSGDAGAHLSRIAGEGDLCGARENQFHHRGHREE